MIAAEQVEALDVRIQKERGDFFAHVLGPATQLCASSTAGLPVFVPSLAETEVKALLESARELTALLAAQPRCRSGCGRPATTLVHGPCWTYVYCDQHAPEQLSPRDLDTAPIIRRLGYQPKTEGSACR